VEAAADHKEQLKKELKELNERKIQAMAEIEAQEEMEDEEEECLRVSGVDVTMHGVEDDDVQPKSLEEKDGFC
jgi:N-acetylglucosamine-6-phosphate deacetylase